MSKSAGDTHSRCSAGLALHAGAQCGCITQSQKMKPVEKLSTLDTFRRTLTWTEQTVLSGQNRRLTDELTDKCRPLTCASMKTSIRPAFIGHSPGRFRTNAGKKHGLGTRRRFWRI